MYFWTLLDSDFIYFRIVRKEHCPWLIVTCFSEHAGKSSDEIFPLVLDFDIYRLISIILRGIMLLNSNFDIN